LGYDWIKNHNPSINWQTGSIDFDRCPLKFNCKTNLHSMTPWARAAANISAEIAAAKEMVKEKKTWKEIVPQHYHQTKQFSPRIHSTHYWTNDHGTMP
jgi:ribosomal protein L16/L10AE